MEWARGRGDHQLGWAWVWDVFPRITCSRWVCSGKLESFAGFYDTGAESSCLVCLLPAPNPGVSVVMAGQGTWMS